MAPDVSAVLEQDLPTWNLTDLYPGMDSPELASDIARAGSDAASFAARYGGKVATLGAEQLAVAVETYEALQELMGRIGTYAQLLFAGDMTDPAIAQFQQNVQEKLTDIGATLLFFALEINRIADDDLERMQAEPRLAVWSPWLRDVRAFRPHQLSDDLEKLLHEKHVTGRGAWTRLFDETMARLRFPIDGKALTSAQALHLLSDRDPTKRRMAAKSIGNVLGETAPTFALITNTLAKDWEIGNRWRRYARVDSSRNLGNYVEDSVVDALMQAVRASYPRLSHRYYALKAKWLGAETMPYWDRNAPLPQAADREIPWREAQDTVLDAYNAFSPDLAGIGQKFFENGWIDAPTRPGKSPGAFAHPSVPSVHPYLLLNYQGKVRDVMTLAHELGHGVHQVLAAKQGYLRSDTPLTLAETASVFGEMLTFRALLAKQTDPAQRRMMLASKVEDMINTVVRQIAFYDFELRLHNERQKGELTAERIGELWLAVQAESLGPAIRFEPEYRWYWSYIPHFVHSPFYVYAYAFGDCLVNSLYSVYESGHPDFQRKYLDMLRAGGTKRHRDLLAPFGLDASDPAFWNRGLSVVSGFIDQLEAAE